MVHKLEISIPSQVNSIYEVENFLEGFTATFKLSSKLLGRINLSVMEAVGNAILYGNNKDVRKMVTVVAEEKSNQIIFTISDEGKGFDYTNIPDPTLQENIEKESKRGLFLMKVLSDDLIFENNGATVIMIFDL